MTRYLATFLALVLFVFAGVASAQDGPITIQPGFAVTYDIEVPEDAHILTLTASEPNGVPVYILTKYGAPWDLAGDLSAQLEHLAQVSIDGPAVVSIGTYSDPPLQAGTMHVLLLNSGQLLDAQVTFEASINTGLATTEFNVNFDAPSQDLIDVFGSVEDLQCDTAPWHDTTATGDTTLGEYRQEVFLAALDKLSTQMHSPVPVNVQACWTEFPDDNPNDGLFTLAAAGGVYTITLGDPAIAYPMATVGRILGHRICGTYIEGLPCSIPDIIVRFNSDSNIEPLYANPGYRDAVISVTMHEVMHGLGFLSGMTLDGSDDEFLAPSVDAFTNNVAYLGGSNHDQVMPLNDLTDSDREDALTSGQYLVWNDPELAADPQNALRNNPPPTNYVELYAPSSIELGSTLSHLNGAAHPGQLMDAFLPPSHPQNIGLACGMMAKAGWGTGPDIQGCVVAPSGPPTGTWSDANHSPHGIDLESFGNMDAYFPDGGDIYSILFYTFDANGEPEYYGSTLRLVNGHLGSVEDPTAEPSFLNRPVYDPATHDVTFPDGIVGSISMDFTDAAAADPACAGHTREPMALMRWTIGNESGTWCMSPIIVSELRPDPATDLSGVWSAGQSDSGWGLTETQFVVNGATQETALIYYYDDDNQPRWGITDVADYAPGTPVPVYETLGYCRTCTKAPTSTFQVGTMTLNLNTQEHDDELSGDNTVSVDINYDDRSFQRTDTAVRMLSIPVGE